MTKIAAVFTVNADGKGMPSRDMPCDVEWANLNTMLQYSVVDTLRSNNVNVLEVSMLQGEDVAAEKSVHAVLDEALRVLNRGFDPNVQLGKRPLVVITPYLWPSRNTMSETVSEFLKSMTILGYKWQTFDFVVVLNRELFEHTQFVCGEPIGRDAPTGKVMLLRELPGKQGDCALVKITVGDESGELFGNELTGFTSVSLTMAEVANCGTAALLDAPTTANIDAGFKALFDASQV